jgi:hypothetical protein
MIVPAGVWDEGRGRGANASRPQPVSVGETLCCSSSTTVRALLQSVCAQTQ